MTQKKRLGEPLVETGLLSPENREKALAIQQQGGGRLGEVIVEMGLATEEEIAQALGIQLGVPILDLTETPVEPQAVELVSEKVARRHLLLPVSVEQGQLHIAMADPLNFEALEDVRFASGYAVKASVATRSQMIWAIDQHYLLRASKSGILKDIADERSVEIVAEAKELD